tara:strand:+ start:9383 stop:9586 length:204 start_codon:yes stop_codon:yes gene_type:complete
MKEVGTYWKNADNRIYKIIGYKEFLQSQDRVKIVFSSGHGRSHWRIPSQLRNDTPSTEDEFLITSIK